MAFSSATPSRWKIGSAPGAKVEGELVYLDRGLVRELIKTIPSDFTYHARDPQKKMLRLGGKHSMFIPMTGAPFLRDLEDVRRNPLLEDLAMFHKLAHMMPAMHSSAHHIVEPYDHPISQRHLRITYSSMKYSDKTFIGHDTNQPQERRGCDRHVRDPVWGGFHRQPPGGDRQLQRQLAAGLG